MNTVYFLKDMAREDWKRELLWMEYDRELMVYRNELRAVVPTEIQADGIGGIVGGWTDRSSPYSYTSMLHFDASRLSTSANAMAVYSPAFVSSLLFDFDSPILEYALKDTMLFCEMLGEVHYVDPTHYRIYFSGFKGFHVEIPVELFAEEEARPLGFFDAKKGLRAFAVELAGGFKTFDNRIYDNRRLVRLPFRKHPASGLHRIPLSFSDLYQPLEAITEGAREPSGLWGSLSGEYLYPPFEMPEKPLLGEVFHATQALVQINRPREMRSVIRDLFLPAEQGRRNIAAVRLAGLLKSKGIELSLAQLFMQSWNRSNKPPLPEDELAYLVKGVFERYR
jgi:hypothetical protein